MKILEAIGALCLFIYLFWFVLRLLIEEGDDEPEKLLLPYLS